MQNIQFLGLPAPLWGLLCFVVAGIFIFIWPKPKKGAAASSFGRHFILRWFHSLAWVLFAMCAILSGRSAVWAAAFGVAGGLVYLTFITTMMRK